MFFNRSAKIKHCFDGAKNKKFISLKYKIIKKYQSGYSISKLLQEYPKYSRKQINQLLEANNVAIRGGRKRKLQSLEEISILSKMLDEGAFLKDISKYFNTSDEVVRRAMRENGLQLKTLNRKNRNIKSDFFTNIDAPEKAYWLGFLFTDGCVDKYKTTGRIRLQLQERDKEILEKFKEDLSLNNDIIYDVRPNSVCCSVEFTDEQIFNDLAKYDIIPQKTYKVERIPYEKIPKEFLSAFALGLFDGDGSLSCSDNFSSDVTFGYAAYHETEVIDFQNMINNLVGISKNNKNFFTSAWHTQWRGRLQVIKILDVLYKDCPRFLKRKHDIYIKLKQSLK